VISAKGAAPLNCTIRFWPYHLMNEKATEMRNLRCFDAPLPERFAEDGFQLCQA
jgi:hypothetical protein